MGKWFGTDGVRGIANTELTPEMAFRLGRAGAYVLTREKRHAPKIIVGMDTRISGDMLEAALTAGMCSIGARVYSAGILPTPGIAHLVKKYDLDAGVVISASHNPVQDNGIKFFDARGYKLPDELENEIEALMETTPDTLPRPTGEQVGARMPCEEALKDYIAFLKSTLGGVRLDGIKVALDCANGATYQAAPIIFSDLGAELYAIHNEPNGININLDCGSTHVESLVEYVVQNKMDIGLAFDGDGDRLIAVDEKGKILDGDEIMSIWGYHLKQNGRLKHDTIVATVMSNLGFIIMGQKHGIHIEQTAVGDRYVLERMLEGDFVLGGEQSGHIINREHSTTGDGILAGLHLLKTMKETGKSLSELNTLMEIMPQVLVGARVDNEKKNDYLTDPVIEQEIRALEDRFAGEGRVLIRPSGTEPLVRVMIEGWDKESLEQEAQRVAALIEERLQ